MLESLIKKYFDKYKIEYESNKIESFVEYAKYLKESNKRINLTSIVEDEDIVIKHFLDSVIAYRKFPLNSKVIDIGSGAGFPAIPLKILSPDLDFLMVEATRKKVNFLNSTIELLSLDNIEAIHERAENIGRYEKYREKYDICTARAFAPLRELVEYLAPFVSVNGKIIAYKGPEVDKEIKEAESALEKLNLKILDVERLDLEDNKRNIIYIQKTNTLDAKYPRSHKKITTNPLW